MIVLSLSGILACTSKTDLPTERELRFVFVNDQERFLSPIGQQASVYPILMKLDSIPNPHTQTNEDKVQWPSQRKWLYMTDVAIDTAKYPKAYHELVFEGIDTYADIYLNDKLVLQTDNAFRTYRIPIKKRSVLKIWVHPTDSIEAKKAASLPYTLPEGLRIFTRKPQYQYGWDWGPKLKNMGLWKPVKLISYNTNKIKQVGIHNQLLPNKALLHVQLDLQQPPSENLQLEIFRNKKLVLDTLVSSAKSKYILPIENPKLWWPHHMGTPYLYDIEVMVKHQNRLIDKRLIKHGIREARLVQQPDSLGKSFYFEINGKAVYAKGANYIPQHSFPDMVKKQDYQRLLQLAKDANMNMLRVWGGGIYEKDIFYELCDQLGIMVWQDFMFACAMYPGDREFLENVAIEAQQQLERLQNHASIVLWCGNNENSEGWHRWGWQADKTEAQKEEIWGNYLKVFDSVLPQKVAQYSHGISYHESSPTYGRGDKRYISQGDAHDWWVWHDGKPFEHFQTAVPRFMSEFGFQSYPNRASLLAIDSLAYSRKDSPAMAQHQKHHRGFALMDTYMKRDFLVPSAPDWYYYTTQLVQARGIGMGMRAHRLAKPYNMGSLYWQLNDCWPAISWSSIDFHHTPKALHYTAKEAFDNTLVHAKIKDQALQFEMVLDSVHPKTIDLQWHMINQQGDTLKSYPKESYTLATDQVTKSKSYALPANFNPKKHFLLKQWGNKQQVQYFAKPKDLELAPQEIEMQIISNRDRTQDIVLEAPNLHLKVFVDLPLGTQIEDNFIELLPGIPKTLRLSGKELVNRNGIRVYSLNGIRGE